VYEADRAVEDCAFGLPAVRPTEWSDVPDDDLKPADWVDGLETTSLSACGRLLLVTADVTGDDEGWSGALYRLPDDAGSGPTLLARLPGAVSGCVVSGSAGGGSFALWAAMDGPGLRASRVAYAPIDWAADGGAVLGPSEQVLSEPPRLVPGAAAASFFVAVAACKDGSAATVNLNDRDVSEVLLARRGEDDGRLRTATVWPRERRRQCFVERAGAASLVALVQADEAGSMGVAELPVSSLDWCGGPAPADAAWAPLVSGGEEEAEEAEDLHVMTGPPRAGGGARSDDVIGVVVRDKRSGRQGLRVLSRAAGSSQGGWAGGVAWPPGDVCELESGANSDASADAVTFLLRSPVQPARQGWVDVGDAALASARPVVRSSGGPAKAAAAMAALRLPALVALRGLAPGAGGRGVPVTVVRPASQLRPAEGAEAGVRGVDASGAERRYRLRPEAGPVLLELYGCYGTPTPAALDLEAGLLLRRGWGLAFPSLRGGGDLGAAWAKAGMGTSKAATLDDAWAAAAWLVDCGAAAGGGVAVRGVSAGGAVAAATLLRQARSDDERLVGAGVLVSPFLDVTGTLLGADNDAALASVEVTEFGRPDPGTGLPTSAWDPLLEARGGGQSLGRVAPTLITGVASDPRTPWAALEEFSGLVNRAAAAAGRGGDVVSLVRLEGSHSATSRETEAAMLLATLGEGEPVGRDGQEGATWLQRALRQLVPA